MARELSHDSNVNLQKTFISSGKFVEGEVVLRGGKPWGFSVTGGDGDAYLRIDMIEPGGRADKEGHLCLGDHILRINDVSVRSAAEAEDVINAAFKTLAVKVARSDLDQTQSPTTTPHTAAFAKRVGDLREVDLDRSQDDSLVFIESPSKKSGTKLKNQRRGESFNLKNTSPAWGSTETRESTPTSTKRKWSFKKFGFTKRSSSTDQTSKEAAGSNDYIFGNARPQGGSGDFNAQLIGSHSSTVSSTDSHMIQSSPSLHQYSRNSDVTMVTGSPNMAHSQTWQGQELTSKSSSNFGYTQSNGELAESNGYSDNSVVGKENRVPPGYKSLLEYKVSQINKSYSTSAIPASTSTKNHRRSNNYENSPSYSFVSDQSNDASSYMSPRSNSMSSPHTPKESLTVHRYNSDNSNAPSLPPRTYQEEIPQDLTHYSDQAFRDGHPSKQKGHSKNPSWPVDTAQVGSISEANVVSGSWSDINAASPSPRTAKHVKTLFQPSLNPHLEEKINPKDVKRQLEEHRLRSPKEPPTRQPMMARADSETGRAFVFGSDSVEKFEASNKEAETLMHGSADGHSTAPPLSPSGSVATKNSSVLNDVSWNVVNTPSAGYMYIVRQKPCYNTSTQTDTPKSEPSDSLKSPSDSVLTGTASAGSLRSNVKTLVTEDRAVQARPGSIVAASMPSGMKSVGVGSEQDFDSLEHSEQNSLLQSPSKLSNPDSEISENLSAKHWDVKPKSPKNKSVSSSTPYYLGDEDIAKIQEQSSESAMLRKLSQEYFMQRNPGQRLSANMDDEQIVRKLSLPEEKPPESPRRLRANDRALESKVSRTTKNALIEMRKDIEYFEMQEHQCKTPTGAFEPVDCNDNHKTDRKLSQGSSHVGAFGVSSSGQKSKDSKRDNMDVSQTGNENSDTTNMDTHSIAEQARKEWIQTGMFQKYGGGPKALKRTVSEQVKPSKELSKGKNKQSQVKHGTHNTDTDKRHKISDPGSEKVSDKVEHSYQTSDPTTNHRAYMIHENRLSSDSEALPQMRYDRKQRPGSNVSNRSSSSGSTGADDKNRTSDPDLKRLQHKAVLNFFELKTGKRLSSSSIDSSAGAELAIPKEKSQDSWHQPKSPSPFKPSEDRTTTPIKKSLTSPNSLSNPSSRRRASAGANLAPRRSTKDSGSSGPEMSPPVLLDTSSTPAMRGIHSYSSSTTSTSLSPSDPHSPPLHPWPVDLNKVSFPGEVMEHAKQVDDTVNMRLSQVTCEGSKPQDDDITELKRRMLEETDIKLHHAEIESETVDQTGLKALQYSTSSTDESPSGHSLSTDPRFAYQLTSGNKLKGDPTEEDVAPALPPRNYRNQHFVPEPAGARGQKPEPMAEPPREPRKESHRLSANNMAENHSNRLSSSSSYTDVFTSDFDATPARDMYADQLRQSARRISQSHINPYLNPARYQSKPVAELKPNVATSRPVDKPSMGTSEPLLHTSVISSTKDYSGLSSDGDSPKRSSSTTLHSPTDRSSSSGTTPVHHGNNTDPSRYTPGATSDPSKRNQSVDSDSFRVHHSPQGSGSSDHGVYLTPVSHSKIGSSHTSPSNHDPNSQQRAAYNQRHRDPAHVSPNHSERPPRNHESSSELDDLPVPPPLPPPHHQPYHSPSNSRLEDKPLPPLPTSEGDTQERFSGESYISNKSNNYRQGYRGNYRRGGELSPKSPAAPYSPRSGVESSKNNHTSASTQPPTAGETMVTVTKVVTVNNKYPGDMTSPMQNNKQQDSDKHKSPAPTTPSNSGGLPWERKSSVGEAVPWAQKSYAPVQPFVVTSKPAVDTPSKSEERGGEENPQDSDSPSVKSYIANIEQKGKHRGKDRGHLAKAKFPNLKDTLDRRSYERETTGQTVRSRVHDSPPDSHQSRVVPEPGHHHHQHMSLSEDINPTHTQPPHQPQRGEASRYKRDGGKGYSHSHTKSDPLQTDRLEFSPMTRTRSVESEKLNYTRRTSDASQTDLSNQSGGELELNYSCEVRETSPLQQSMNSFEISHSRERSDPQSDGDTRSNDSGVAEDMSHSRQKSQEEIECEKQAALVASHLKDKLLSQVILPPPEHKTTTDYVTGLFDTKVNPNRKPSLRNSAATRAQIESLKKGPATIEDTPAKSPSSTTALPANSPYWSPPSLANLQNKMRQEGVQPDDILPTREKVSLDSEKDELILRIEKKLEILKEEKTLLEVEIKENESLGKELSELVMRKVQNKPEYNKYHLYVTELDKVMILLLKLSGRLARAENAISSLSEEATQDERSPLLAKRDELLEKLEDAKELKEGIDRRSKQVSVILKRQLTDSENEDYQYFIKMKSKLTMDQQEINDKLKLGEEQLSALRKSMNQSDC